MNNIIGTVQNIEGTFFAKDESGKITQLRNSDAITQDMLVYGDLLNEPSSKILISKLSDNSIVEILASEEKLLNDSSINPSTDDTSYMDKLLEELASSEEEEESEDTDAGEEKVKSEGGDSTVDARDGNIVDVNSDLRDAKFKFTGHLFDIEDQFESESEERLSSEPLSSSNTAPQGPTAIPSPTPTPTPTVPVTPAPQTVIPPTPPAPTPPPAPTTTVKVFASDASGNPLKNASGNYLEVNEAPEGGTAYYVALAFKPGSIVYNDTTKLTTQEGTVDFSFTDGSAKSSDYTPQGGLTTIALGTAISANADDDYIADNGETFTVNITNFIPAIGTEYGETNVSTSNVTTTIKDNPSKINQSDSDTGNDDPTNGDYSRNDTVYAIITGPADVNEGSSTTNYTLKLIDQNGTTVTVTKETKITVTYQHNDTNPTQDTDTEYNDGDTIEVTIPANGTTGSFLVTTIDDIYKDDGEKFKLTITDIENTGEFENVKIGNKDGNFTNVITTINDNTNSGTEIDVDTVKIVLVAVDTPATVTDYTDLPVDGNGVLIIDNDNITSEGEKFYYIPVAVDADGKPLTTQDGTVDLTYTNINTTATDYDSTKTTTNIGEVFSVDALVDATTGEPNEDFTVTITNPQSTPYETPIIDTVNDTVTSTIDGKVYVKIINNDTQIEGNDLTHTVVLTDVNGNPINSNVPAGEALTITLEYSNDSTENADFSAPKEAVPFTVVIPAGENSIVITNSTIDDFTPDNGENYSLTITDITQANASFDGVGIIATENSVIGTILDGVTLGDPTDASVDEDVFDVENNVVSITDTQSLNIVSPDGDDAYELLFEGTPTFTSNDGSFNTADGDTLKSDGVVIEYVVSENTTTAYAGSGRAEGDRVFVITLDKQGVGGADDDYTYTQYKNIDHPISGNGNASDDDDVVLTFAYKITDQGQTSSVENFTVTVSDSLPSSTNQDVELNEDTSKIIYISDESFDGGIINLDNGVDAASDVANGDSIDIYDTAKDDVVGSLKNNGDGTLTFTPNADYSGDTAGFTYDVSDGDGDTATASVGITVTPVADAPTLENKTIETWEDANTDDVDAEDGNQREGSNVKVLGLAIPVKEDQIDQNDADVTNDSGTTLGDNPERLGAIEFSFATSGNFGTATIGYDTNGDGTLDGTLQTIDKDSIFTIDITDVANYHVDGTSGTYSLTQAQYETIAIMHDEDNATNIKTKISVASHEVDENGAVYSPDIVSSEASQIVTLDVKAVTDDISPLEFNAGNAKTHTYTIPDNTKEGTLVIDVATLLKNQVLGDNDGSEKRWYEISGLAPDSIVTLGTSKATVDSNGDVKINFPNNQEPNPVFTIEFPEQYSATGINISPIITLKVQDTDSDSTVTPEIKTDSVTFNITGDIAPVADLATIQVSQAVGYEDAGRTGGNTDAKDGTINANGTGGIPLSIKVSSDDKDGSEKFDVTISTIPANAVIYYDETLQTQTSNSITIVDFDNAKSLVIIPPHNSDADFTLNVSATTKDGASVSAPTVTTIDVIVKNVADAPVGTDLNTGINVNEDNQLNFQSIYTTPANLASYDSSEVLTIKVDLPTGFSIDSGSPFYIENGLYVVKASDITAGNIKLVVPENFSGNAELKLTYVTTEKAGEGDSKTWNTQTVNIFVNPIADDVTVTTSSTINEDADGSTNKIDLKPTLSDADTKGVETIDSVKILASDVPAGYELFLGSANGTSIASKLVGGYYVLTSAEADSVYAKNTTAHDADNVDSFPLTVVYTVTDTNGGTDTKEFTHTHTVNVKAVTDAPTLTLGTITQESGSVTISGSNVTVVNEDSQFKVPVTTTSSDQDGSEAVTKIVISGVPMGVEVVGATYYGYSGSVHNGIWEIVAPVDATLDANGALSDITFKVNTGADFDERDITITTYTQDGANADVESTSKTIHINAFDAPSTGTGNPPLFDLSTKAATIYEDNNDGTNDVIYNLGKSIAVANSGGSASGNYAITLTDFPEGTTVENASYSYEDAGKTYYVVTGTGNAADVETALSNVIVTPPTDMNTGGDTDGQMTFSATISTYDGGTFKDGTGIPAYSETIIPVTDEMTVAVTADNINEDGTSDISITLTNPNDGSKTELLNNSITIKVTETWGDVATGSSTQSTLTDSSGKYNVADNGDGTYTITPKDVANNFTVGNTITGLQYTPAEHRDGRVNFEVTVKNQETGSTVTLDSTGNTDITVTPVVDAVINATTVIATGTEDTDSDGTGLANPVKLEIKADALPDGSETLGNIILDEVPNGFTVWYKDGGSFVMATNIGTTTGTAFDLTPNISGDADVTRNKWLVPNDGTMPEIYINAPVNWSGDFDFKTTVNVKEENLDTYTPNTVSVTGHIHAVADDVTIDPTLTFGDAFSWIDLKLNANMVDVDGSETMSLNITGLDDSAQFRLSDGTAITAILSDGGDAATDTSNVWRIEGIDYDQINNIQFTQDTSATGVSVEAWTVDSTNTNSDTSGSVTSTFNVTLANVSGTLTLDKGINLDFSKLDDLSALSNVNTIDLSATGENKIIGLTLDDVLNMTDNNELIITGTNDDTVSFKAGDGWSSTSGTGADSGYEVYTNSGNSDLQVKVDTNITDSII